MKVEQLMTRHVQTCQPSDGLDVPAHIMWERDCGIVPVVAGPMVVGVITDRDICMAAYTRGQALREIQVAAAMSPRVYSCRATDSLATALKVMQTNQVRRLPVVDSEDHVVGILSLADIAREGRHERGQRKAEVKHNALAETLAAVSEPRYAPGEIVAVSAPAGD
jgi:CBS domain-containing protein